MVKTALATEDPGDNIFTITLSKEVTHYESSSRSSIGFKFSCTCGYTLHKTTSRLAAEHLSYEHIKSYHWGKTFNILFPKDN